MNQGPYKRVLLKVSGESFAGDQDRGIDPKTVMMMATEIASVANLGLQVAVVVGGGNIFRGTTGEALGIQRSTGDYMGMLATTINGLAMRDALEQLGVPTRVQTAIWMQEIAEPFIRGRALRHLEKGRVVIFAAGTGNPYFSTDTTAALRAAEIGADAVLMGKRAGGVFDRDPETDSSATFIKHLTYMQVLEQDLKVMDATAITLCRDNALPIRVFNLLEPGAFSAVVNGEPVGTTISERLDKGAM